jgi:hypothetical protein
MKKLILVLALVAGAVAQQATPAQAPAAQDPTSAKARAMLDKMVAALGGQAYMTFKTMTQEGRTYSFFQGRPNSAGAPFWRFYQYPDKERIELTKQRDIVDIFTGDKGYEITYKGTTNVEAKDLDAYLRRRNYSMETILREWLKDPATLIYTQGTALADQNMVQLITLVNKNNDAVTIGIDPNTNLPLKKSYTYRDPFDNLKSTDDEIYANYRNVQGIQTPFSVVRYHNGDQTGQRFITKVEYNVPIPDSMFDAKVTYDLNKLNEGKKKK